MVRKHKTFIQEAFMETQRTAFTLGQMLITPGARDTLEPEDVMLAMRRHAKGDWGDCCPDDREANNAALLDEARILSVHHDRFGVKFWIITEADRSATTVILPAEY